MFYHPFRPLVLLLWVWLCAGIYAASAGAADLGDVQLSGNASGQYRYFADDGSRSGLSTSDISLAGELEFYYPVPDSRDSFTFTPFYRWDEHDDDRTHGDIRELKWHKVEQDWELTVG